MSLVSRAHFYGLFLAVALAGALGLSARADITYGATNSSSSEFTYTDLQKLITDNHITKMEDLIKALPEELRSNFTLMYDSQSIQGATRDRPRAILFGKTGNLIISFNGDSSQMGGDRLEIMEAVEQKDPSTGKDKTTGFVMHEETFFPKEPGRAPEPSDAPSSCTHCHGDPPHPIWKSYPRWDGAYGSMDDGISTDKVEYEGKSFRDFLKTARPDKKIKNQILNPRYRQLLWPPDQPLFPYHAAYDSPGRNLGTMPNARMNILLSERNIEAYQAELEKNPHYNEEKYQIPYLKFCDDPRAAGKNLNPLMDFGIKRPLDLRFGSDENAYGESSDFNLGVYISNTLNELDPTLRGTSDVVLRMAVLDRLAESDPELDAALKQIPVNYMSFARGTYQNTDPDFLSFVSTRPTAYDVKKMQNVCQILKKRVNAEIAQEENVANAQAACPPSNPPVAPQVTATANTATQAARILTRSLDQKALNILQSKGCIDCHNPAQGPPVGPPMHFNDAKQMRADLKAIRKDGKPLIDVINGRISPEADPATRMPFRGPPLSKDEKDSIMEYLKSLEN